MYLVQDALDSHWSIRKPYRLWSKLAIDGSNLLAKESQ